MRNMQASTVQALLETKLPTAKVIVHSNDNVHYEVTVIDADFVGKSLLQQQRTVNHILKADIESGLIHAVSIKTYTPQAWEALQHGKSS